MAQTNQTIQHALQYYRGLFVNDEDQAILNDIDDTLDADFPLDFDITYQALRAYRHYLNDPITTADIKHALHYYHNQFVDSDDQATLDDIGEALNSDRPLKFSVTYDALDNYRQHLNHACILKDAAKTQSKRTIKTIDALINQKSE